MNGKNEYSFYIDTSIEAKDLTADDILNCWPLNNRFFGKLLNAMNSKNLVPLIGAGLTNSYSKESFPGWKTLLVKIAEDVGLGKNEIGKIKEYIEINKFEEAAQMLEDICGKNHIQELLRDVFSSSKLDDTKFSEKSSLMSLINIHPKIILTTNYDCAIERAYSLIPKKFLSNTEDYITEELKVLTPGSSTRNFVKAINESSIDNSSKVILYKFHGDVNDNGETHDLILSKKSYDKYYGKSENICENLIEKDLVRNLQIFLFSKTILFIGCSLNQDRIMDLISDNTDVDHYAFVGCGSDNRLKFCIEEANEEALDRSEKLNELNIHPIFYPRYARVAVNKLLDSLSDKNTSLYASSIHPKKSTWMNNYFSQLEIVEKHIIIFGGIGRNLREKTEIISLLENLLKNNEKSKLYICYDSDNAALHRDKQVNAEIERKETNEKIKEIKKIPNLFSIEDKDERIVVVPIKYDLTGYAILIDDDFFWNIITEQRSSDSPIINLDIKVGTNINFINYIKYASEQTKNIIEGEIKELTETYNVKEYNMDMTSLNKDLSGIKSIIEIMNEYLEKYA